MEVEHGNPIFVRILLSGGRGDDGHSIDCVDIFGVVRLFLVLVLPVYHRVDALWVLVGVLGARFVQF